MYLQSVSLNHFRNYAALQLGLCPRVNCLTGPNGSGKTNFLEAIYYLSYTKGFHTDKSALQHGAPFFTIDAELRGTDVIAAKLGCAYVPGKGKKMLRDRQPLARLSDHVSALPLVCVLPKDAELITASGQARRNWANYLLSQFDKAYFEALLRYEKALKQRNALLANFLESYAFQPELLEPWNLQLAKHGALLSARRLAFVKDFQPVFDEFYARISEGREAPAVQYRSGVRGLDEAGWLAYLEEQAPKDRAAGRTTGGVHRDDFQFMNDGHAVRYFGSQGQQKTFVAALKFAQYSFMRAQTGKPPILLLDDVFDKLDDARVGQIARLLAEELTGQVFVTDTSAQRLRHVFKNKDIQEIAYYSVKAGEIEETDAKSAC